MGRWWLGIRAGVVGGIRCLLMGVIRVVRMWMMRRLGLIRFSLLLGVLFDGGRSSVFYCQFIGLNLSNLWTWQFSFLVGNLVWKILNQEDGVLYICGPYKESFAEKV